MGWDGMGWDGMGWDGMGWDGMGWVDVGGVRQTDSLSRAFLKFFFTFNSSSCTA
jgi:hypothetical protein